MQGWCGYTTGTRRSVTIVFSQATWKSKKYIVWKVLFHQRIALKQLCSVIWAEVSESCVLLLLFTDIIILNTGLALWYENLKLGQSHSYLCVLEVMSPEGSDLVLATHVPYSETDIFIFYCLHIETCTGRREGTDLNTVSWVKHVEVKTINRTITEFTVSVSLTNGWDGGYNFAELQFVQDSRLSCSIQPNCREKVWLTSTRRG